MPKSSPFQLVGFGEAMIRYAPIPTPAEVVLPDPTAGAFLRSVGGDELNVAVDFGRLDGRPAKWISTVPEGPLGDLVCQSGVLAGVDCADVVRVPNASVGTFTVLPELKTVHYQRKEAAFATLDPSAYDWNALLSPEGGVPKWLHMTGITPMIAAPPRVAWLDALQTAYSLRVPVSMDFNHRKQLGPLEDLWSVMEPQLKHLQVIIFSLVSLIEVVEMEGQPIAAAGESLKDVQKSDPRWRVFMAETRKRWGVARLVVCFKTRDEAGLQRRWSALADAAGVHTTEKIPVYHFPKDECGGGSAWAAGLLDRFYQTGWDAPAASTDPTADIHDGEMVQAIRRADLLAAMCQEAIGDHSQVKRAELAHVEGAYADKSINLDEAMTSLPASTDHTEEILQTLAALKVSGVLGIIRAKNADAAIARGIELASLGCKALEVTLDTTDWRRVLKELATKCPSHVCVGVGTVMDDTVQCLEEIKQLGGKFALSPLNPLGFIDECHRVGLLAVPAGYTSNELWDMKRQGAMMLKMFHAGLVGPKILKSMLGVSPLAAMNIMPSGGCSPANADEWLDAGAAVIGMGSNLAGKDINHPYDSDAYTAAKAYWDATGKTTAKKLFEQIHARYGSAPAAGESWPTKPVAFKPKSSAAAPGAKEDINATLAALKVSGVLGIIRAKNADAAIARGIELASLGCKALEVTLDTTDWRRVLKELATKCPSHVCVGVGTVMDDTVQCLEEIKQLGGKFALSPLNPLGFIDECHRIGLLAVPAGYTSNELWDMKRQGAMMLKMFHAGLVGPKILKSMLGVSPLAAMNIMPSGGCSPANADEWLDAGAAVIGMGSNLAGKDINHPYDSDAYTAAKADWDATGKTTAKKLFEQIHARYGSAPAAGESWPTKPVAFKPKSSAAAPGAKEDINATLAALKVSGVLGIIRAKNADAAIARGIELASLGCKALEVTLDTTDWRRVLKELATKCPSHVCVGVGTVMDDTVQCLEEIKQLGGKFALSPLNPLGFIDECHRVGLLAVPAGYTSNELWDMKRQGAMMLKMFHAGLVGPKILKSMLGVSPLAAMNIMPSGGCSPANADEWLDAGAAVIGMGSNLAGKDINHPYDSDAYTAAKADWDATGKTTAKKLFEQIHARYGSA